MHNVLNIGVHHDSYPAPVPSGKATLALQHEVKKIKVSSSSTRWLHTVLMAGGEKSIRHFYWTEFLEIIIVCAPFIIKPICWKKWSSIYHFSLCSQRGTQGYNRTDRQTIKSTCNSQETKSRFGINYDTSLTRHTTPQHMNEHS